MTACAAMLLSVSGLAMAEEAPAPDEAAADRTKTIDAAKEHNRAAMRLFNLGKFEEAVEAYQKAYKAHPLPEFLYNLGQCHERMQGMENLTRARFFYEGYLTNKPDAGNRQEVEELIKELNRKIDTLHAAGRQVVIIPPGVNALGEPPPPTPWYKSWWFWTIVSVAVAGGAAAAVVLNLPEEPTPVEGSLWPRTVELELSW